MAEERVASLKLSIQCAKLLGDTSQPHYYPAMFCYVTDVLESFGKMVFDRIKVRINLSFSLFLVLEAFRGDAIYHFSYSSYNYHSSNLLNPKICLWCGP